MINKNDYLSEKKYQQALSSAEIGLWEINFLANKIFLGENLAAVFDMTSEEARDSIPLSVWYQKINLKDLESVKQSINLKNQQNDHWEIFFRINLRSKKIRYVRMRGQGLKNDSDQIASATGVCWDATQEILQKKKLIKSKVFFERVIDALPDPIFVKDKDFLCLFGNTEFENLIGKKRHEFLGKNDRDFLPQEMVEVCLQKDIEAFSTGLGNENYEKIQSSSGETRELMTKKTPFQLSKTETVLIGIIRDITEKNRFDSQFRLMVSLIDSSGDLFGFTDSRGVTAYVNKAGQDLLGIEVGKKHFTDYFSPGDKKSFLENILPNLRHPEGWQGEIVIINSNNGQEVPIWLHLFSVVPKDSPDTVFYAYTGSDLRKLLKIQNSLIGQSKMAALGEMAAEIAHEINNPLAIIQGKSQIMLERLRLGTVDLEKLKRDLELIERNSLRIQKIINSSKALARKSEKDPYEYCSILKIVEESFEICTERFQKHHLLLTTHIMDQIDYTDIIQVRSSEIIQVIVNLLNNSFDAIKNDSGGWVKLILTKNEKEYQIEVIDSGEKIPKEISDKMMAPFFTTKATGHGTGLGLSLSRQIVDAHGGQFYYDSKFPNTRFVLVLKRSIKN